MGDMMASFAMLLIDPLAVWKFLHLRVNAERERERGERVYSARAELFRC
jgi:hypothetical protein